MNHLYAFGAVLLLATVAHCQIGVVNNGVVVFGAPTAAGTDLLCYTKRIFKGQASPAYINFYNFVPTVAPNTAKSITYVKVDATIATPIIGGVTAQIIRGGVGGNANPTITLSVSDGTGSSIFTQNVDVTMMCAV